MAVTEIDPVRQQLTLHTLIQQLTGLLMVAGDVPVLVEGYEGGYSNIAELSMKPVIFDTTHYQMGGLYGCYDDVSEPFVEPDYEKQVHPEPAFDAVILKRHS